MIECGENKRLKTKKLQKGSTNMNLWIRICLIRNDRKYKRLKTKKTSKREKEILAQPSVESLDIELDDLEVMFKKTLIICQTNVK